MSKARTARTSNRGAAPEWARLDDEALLDLRFCDLRLRLDEPRLLAGLSRLDAELQHRGIRHRPHAWLAEEWFSPDGVPGIAIPFYLAHARLRKLERRMMHEVEGGAAEELIKILRHEAGHALDTAYGLRRRKAWREVFGKASQRYPVRYSPRPTSRSFVLHLGLWYAQSHPTEDFAETFAVWLPPRSRWRSAYAGWPAMRKLEYVDATFAELRGVRPRNRKRAFVEPLTANRTTLREHYRHKRAKDNFTEAGRYDRWLLRVFSSEREAAGNFSASRFLSAVRPRLCKELGRQVATHPYLIRQVLDASIDRARLLKLRMRRGRVQTEREVLRMLGHIVNDTLARDSETYRL